MLLAFLVFITFFIVPSDGKLVLLILIQEKHQKQHRSSNTEITILFSHGIIKVIAPLTGIVLGLPWWHSG